MHEHPFHRFHSQMRNLLHFVSGHHLIANSEGEKKTKKKSEEKKVKTKKARATFAAVHVLQPLPRG